MNFYAIPFQFKFNFSMFLSWFPFQFYLNSVSIFYLYFYFDFIWSKVNAFALQKRRYFATLWIWPYVMLLCLPLTKRKRKKIKVSYARVDLKVNETSTITVWKWWNHPSIHSPSTTILKRFLNCRREKTKKKKTSSYAQRSVTIKCYPKMLRKWEKKKNIKLRIIPQRVVLTHGMRKKLLTTPSQNCSRQRMLILR